MRLRSVKEYGWDVVVASVAMRSPDHVRPGRGCAGGLRGARLRRRGLHCGDCAGALHPLAWWLATTNRWRTAARLSAPPDHALRSLQSLQKAERSGFVLKSLRSDHLSKRGV